MHESIVGVDLDRFLIAFYSIFSLSHFIKNRTYHIVSHGVSRVYHNFDRFVAKLYILRISCIVEDAG